MRPPAKQSPLYLPLWGAAILCILTLLPIWLVSPAPLTDWPTHLAIAREAYVLLQGQSSVYYHLDFSFLGYSLVHLMLIALQNVFDIWTSGQIVLSLVVLLAPICWWLFFRTLDPAKESWFVIGCLMNYSIFFYQGNINFLFAVSFGLLYLAFGIDSFLNGRRRLAAFAIVGILTYLSHAYAFLLLSALLAGIFFYRRFWEEKPADWKTALILLILFSAAFVNLITISVLKRDNSYYNQVQVCALNVQLTSVPSNREFNQALLMPTILSEVLNRDIPLLYLFRSVWGVSLIIATVILLAMSLIVTAGIRHLLHGESIRQHIGRVLPEIKISFNLLFLAIAFILIMHYWFLPDCPTFICGIPMRSVPFVFAFLALAIHSDSLIKPVFILILILVLFNALFQANAFWQFAPAQNAILSRLQDISAHLPSNAAVFTPPASWNTPDFEGFPPYANPHYHSLLLLNQSSAYVSGMFLLQETFVLRSSFPLFDEMVNYGPFSTKEAPGVAACYAHPPSLYQWSIDANMTLVKNDVNSSVS